MLVPLNIRNSIYEYLLNEGVMTAVEDVRPKCIHPAVKVRNLYVMNVMKSLVSRGYVKKRFAWRTFYWFLTNEGIDYLREVRKFFTSQLKSSLLHLINHPLTPDFPVLVALWVVLACNRTVVVLIVLVLSAKSMPPRRLLLCLKAKYTFVVGPVGGLCKAF
ncbi:40S ribosomal protein S10 [Echinococcus multilocularis]|uniref:40S ribosomal protein S10 n=1 Tax=Echinococcus multilocularis TaxID=6211 RepID=A0A068YD43_ECHMU|nr:40S ribosomal protein S10 [Echinococcus multilocularis]